MWTGSGGHGACEERMWHAKLLEANGSSATIQESKHDTFAVDRRHGSKTKVEFSLLESDANASVLRSPPLGDVQRGHGFQARYNCELELPGRLG